MMMIKKSLPAKIVTTRRDILSCTRIVPRQPRIAALQFYLYAIRQREKDFDFFAITDQIDIDDREAR
jgi:hypothetical protein